MTTKDRILDAAERLFARDGIEATSLRAITTEAGVNLAAVNYHFQSKDALVTAVFMRRVAPVNDQRLAMLEACEREAGDGPLPLERVLDAFVRPVVEIFGSRARDFAPLMGRLYTEPSEYLEKIYKSKIEPVAERFLRAYQRACPDCQETSWCGGCISPWARSATRWLPVTYCDCCPTANAIHPMWKEL